MSNQNTNEPIYNNINLAKILVTDRARKEFDPAKLKELRESIEYLGLLNPLTVQSLPEDHPKRLEGYTVSLVAGERRYRAVTGLGWEDVPCCDKSHYNKLQHKQAELQENICRENLTWAEKSLLEVEINDLYRSIHGDGGSGTGGAGWTIQKQAALLDESPANTSKYVKMGELLKKRPDLKEMLEHLPMATAARRAETILETEKAQAAIDTGQIQISTDLEFGDSVSLIKKIQNGSIDCIITDPPFGQSVINDDEGTTRGDMVTYTGVMSKTDNLNTADVSTLLDTLLPEFHRVLRPGGHCYIFCHFDLFLELCRLNTKFDSNFVLPRDPIIWTKNKTTSAFADYEFLPQYEMILFLKKPPVEPLKNKPSNVLNFSTISAKQKVHVFQKPHELLSVLIEASTIKGDLILDPFAGSGQTLVSARKLGRRSLGFEIDKDNWIRAQKYIDGQKL